MRSCLLCLYAAALVLVIGPAPARMAGAASSPSAQAAGESANVWGGEHAEMEVTPTGANFDFDCAVGTIDHPLALPAEGKFRAAGTYTRERPGPVKGNGSAAAAATYLGTIKGESMHLEVVLGNDKETVGTYDLVRGRSGHVMKCR